jgi:hypothetical protein
LSKLLSNLEVAREVRPLQLRQELSLKIRKNGGLADSVVG